MRGGPSCLLPPRGPWLVGAARGQPSKRTAVNGRGDGVPRAAIMRARPHVKSKLRPRPAPKSPTLRPEHVSEGRIGAPGIAGTARKRLRGGRLDTKNTSRRATPLVAARRTAGRRSARLRSVAPRNRRSLQTEPRALSLRAKHWRPLLCLACSARRRPPQHRRSGAR